MKTYSTVQVADLLDITSDTLHRWIREEKIVAPPVQSLEGLQRVRLWTEEDVEQARRYKADHYRGRGSKKPRAKKQATKKSKKK